MMTSRELIFKIIRDLVVRVLGKPRNIIIDESRVTYFNEKANDFIYQQISEALDKGHGYALGKLGTVELACIVSYLYQQRWSALDLKRFFRGYPIPLFYDKEILRLYNNAGVFPAAKETGDHFCKLMLQDIGAIDTLASYAWCERYITEYLLNCSTVNLDGYYAPFLYKKPWTRVLEGKRVLVILSSTYKCNFLGADNKQ